MGSAISTSISARALDRSTLARPRASVNSIQIAGRARKNVISNPKLSARNVIVSENVKIPMMSPRFTWQADLQSRPGRVHGTNVFIRRFTLRTSIGRDG